MGGVQDCPLRRAQGRCHSAMMVACCKCRVVPTDSDGALSIPAVDPHHYGHRLGRGLCVRDSVGLRADMSLKYLANASRSTSSRYPQEEEVDVAFDVTAWVP